MLRTDSAIYFFFVNEQIFSLYTNFDINEESVLNVIRNK